MRGSLSHLSLPPGGILIHAGDHLPEENQAEALSDLNDLRKLCPMKHSFVIAGNQDPLFLSESAQAGKLLSNAAPDSGLSMKRANSAGFSRFPLPRGGPRDKSSHAMA